MNTKSDTEWLPRPIAADAETRTRFAAMTSNERDAFTQNQNEAYLVRRVRDIIETGRVGEFVLSQGSGDEWFTVERSDGARIEGDLVSVDRGDTVVIHFNAFMRSSREEIPGNGYACVFDPPAEITDSGQLIIRNASASGVFGVFEPGRELIDFRSNGNRIRFDRADALAAKGGLNADAHPDLTGPT